MRFAAPMLSAILLSWAAPALAQAPFSAGEFERGFGMEADSFETPIEPGTRDRNGNRLIVDGRIVTGQSSLFGGLGDGGVGDSLSAGAFGNQLTIVTQGSWNTVIVDSTQINNGDQTVIINGEEQ